MADILIQVLSRVASLILIQYVRVACHAIVIRIISVILDLVLLLLWLLLIGSLLFGR